MTRATGFGLLLFAIACLSGCPGDDPGGAVAEGMGSSNAPGDGGGAGAGAAASSAAGGDDASGAGSGGSAGATTDPARGSVPGDGSSGSDGGDSDASGGADPGTDPGTDTGPGSVPSGDGDAGDGASGSDGAGGASDAGQCLPAGEACSDAPGAPACCGSCVAVACTDSIPPQCSGTCQDGAGDGDAGGKGDSFWFETCGAPVCRVPDPDTGVEPCTTERIGAACDDEGATCDHGAGCGAVLVCATTDPRLRGCPISRARYKRDIEYLDDAELEAVTRELLSMPLATWRYRGDASGREQLGFIIDDVEPSASVRGDVVDLYGYTSMAVAALKRQAAEIEQLEAELDALRGYVLSGRVCE